MRKIYALAAGVATFSLASVALAQEPLDLQPVNIAVRAGIALPLDSRLSDFGSPLIALGVEYQFSRPWIPGGDTYLSVDYMGSSTEFSHGIVPFCINQRFYLSKERLGRRTYAFAGLGAAVVDVSNSNLTVAARGGFGADLGDAIFFEVAGLITDKSNGLSGDSVGFYLGYRF